MMTSRMTSKVLKYSAIFSIIAFTGVQVAEARTTPCGQYDAAYGYYGQCDANNNPIAGTVTTQPTYQPTTTYQPTYQPTSYTNPTSFTTNTYESDAVDVAAARA